MNSWPLHPWICVRPVRSTWSGGYPFSAVCCSIIPHEPNETTHKTDLAVESTLILKLWTSQGRHKRSSTVPSYRLLPRTQTAKCLGPGVGVNRPSLRTLLIFVFFKIHLVSAGRGGLGVHIGGRVSRADFGLALPAHILLHLHDLCPQLWRHGVLVVDVLLCLPDFLYTIECMKIWVYPALTHVTESIFLRRAHSPQLWHILPGLRILLHQASSLELRHRMVALRDLPTPFEPELLPGSQDRVSASLYRIRH